MGVVASIVPFNFPFMVPMWTIPIALCAGNCMIVKPSEKVPMTMGRVAKILKEAGIPDGMQFFLPFFSSRFPSFFRIR
jgi:malonate-semialdehyde dehydrogenase (acetylating)/methylmalonate-semialdehyde dehydrogenase